MSQDNNAFKAVFKTGQTLDISDDKAFRILEENETHYIVKYKNDIYNIEIDSFSEEDKSYTLIINDRPVSLKLHNALDQRIEKMGLNKKKEDNMSQLKAPMPGLVLKINVSVGDAVNEGDSLITLEAMKMENIIKAKGSGVVKSVSVQEQDKVEKAQLLIEFEA